MRKWTEDEEGAGAWFPQESSGTEMETEAGGAFAALGAHALPFSQSLSLLDAESG